MNTCHVCGKPTVENLFDFGRLPICNRFKKTADQEGALFRFVLGQCQTCGVVQLPHPISPAELKSPYNWITYNEPSAHLDDLVKRVAALPGITEASTVCGVFLPSDPTLARFNAQGFGCTWRLDLKTDLEVNDDCAGTETMQAKLDFHSVQRTKERRGSPDILVIRHILEHAHNISELLRGVRNLVKPEGYVIFEVPNCKLPFTTLDYTTLWEEHVLYFTMETFLFCLKKHGFRIVHHETPGVSLVVIAHPGEGMESADGYSVAGELKRGRAFVASFPVWKKRAGAFLENFAREHGKIALFGAGHLSCTFLNLLEIEPFLSCIIDDHEKKQNMFMPGSKLPICPSSALLQRGIKLCLSSLGSPTDRKVMEKNPAFSSNGGQIRSIFPGESYFLDSPIA